MFAWQTNVSKNICKFGTDASEAPLFAFAASEDFYKEQQSVYILMIGS